MKDIARALAYSGFGGCVVTTGLATLAAYRGAWSVWAFDCVLLLVLSAITLINFRIAKSG